MELDDIHSRWQQTARFLDERARRLFAANEAVAHGYGGVTAVSQATGLARQLSAHGFMPVPVDMSELLKAGGSAKCCTLELRS